MTNDEIRFLERAIELSKTGMQGLKGGPFGCVIVKDGKIVGEGSNEVTTSNDPTAHAEVVAIRTACKTDWQGRWIRQAIAIGLDLNQFRIAALKHEQAV